MKEEVETNEKEKGRRSTATTTLTTKTRAEPATRTANKQFNLIRGWVTQSVAAGFPGGTDPRVSHGKLPAVTATYTQQREVYCRLTQDLFGS